MNKAEKTRQFIIEKSAFLINKKGMAGTSISDIMEVTKLAKGGIYGNFENKDEICLASFSYLSGALSNKLDKAIMQGNTAKTKMFGLLDYYVGSTTTEGGCPLLNFGVESDDTHPEMRMRVRKEILNTQKKIFNIITDGVANKEISSELDPKTFSIKVFAMLEGAVLCKKVLGNDEQMRIVIHAIKKEFENYLV